MLTVETKKRQVEDEYGETSEKEYLIVNNIPDEDSYYFGVSGRPQAGLYNREVVEILLNHSFNEVGKSLSKFDYDVDVDWWENSLNLDIYCNEYFDLKIPQIKIDLQLQDWEHWAKPWSMSSVAKEVEIAINNLGDEKIKYWQEDPNSMINGFGLEYLPSDINLNIKKEVDYILGILENVVNTTKKNLLTTLDSESVLTYFHFPEEIKTACKQYLIYFTQFIADMGIVVDTELKEELNHTLFKIVPKDKNESLDKIREALTIYLNAPNDKDFQMELSNQTGVAAKQLEANIYHLKSQLLLATSIIEAKDATIQMLRLSAYQYRQLEESHTNRKETEKEDIIKGIVSLKKYEGKGFSIDFAEILRRLKRSIKK